VVVSTVTVPILSSTVVGAVHGLVVAMGETRISFWLGRSLVVAVRIGCVVVGGVIDGVV